MVVETWLQLDPEACFQWVGTSKGCWGLLTSFVMALEACQVSRPVCNFHWTCSPCDLSCHP